METDKEKARPDDEETSPGEPVESAGALIPLGPTNALDLTGLPEHQREALMEEYFRGEIDVNRRAKELAVDVRALEEALRIMAGTTREMSSQGDAVTISHTQDSAAGRTEIIMGNTEQAQSGKLSKSQTGERDWTPYYIIGGIIAVALVGIAIANNL